jgi:hypothetical protein
MITDGEVGQVCEEAVMSHFNVLIQENYYGSESLSQVLICGPPEYEAHVPITTPQFWIPYPLLYVT